jgi:uncharacterized protein
VSGLCPPELRGKDGVVLEFGSLARRGHLGFSVDATPSSAAQAEEGPERWVVSQVHEGARLAGLRIGDDLVTLDERPIASLAELRFRAAAISPGSPCKLGVLREGKRIFVVVVAEPMPLEVLSHGRVELREVPWRFHGSDYRLRGIWTWPLETARAAVWLLPSASWVSLEMPLTPSDPTFLLVDYLTAHGVATLRVERSGLGDSEGPRTEDLDFEAEFGMWTAARGHFFEHTRQLKRALFGRSLGGMLAPLIAEEQPFDALSVWGTSLDSWHEASLESAAYQGCLQGLDASQLDKTIVALEELQRLVFLEGLTPQEARARAPHLGTIGRNEYRGDLVHGRTARFFQQLEQQDVRAAWQRLHSRVLAVHAEYDILVSEPMMRRLVEQVGSRAEFCSLPRVDHFMHERTSLAEAVERPWGGTFSREAARVLCEFYLRR